MNRKRNIDYCFRLFRSWKGNHYEGTDLQIRAVRTVCIGNDPGAPRPGEEDGGAYFFRTKKEFEQMIEDGALIEYAALCR